MKTIKGPGIFLAQFADNNAPFNSLEGLAVWAAKLGFVGVQIDPESLNILEELFPWIRGMRNELFR